MPVLVVGKQLAQLQSVEGQDLQIHEVLITFISVITLVMGVLAEEQVVITLS